MLTQGRFDLFCRAVTDFGVEHVVLLQDGREIFRRDWKPEERQLQYSVSKSFTGTAVGFALEEGRLTLDDPVISFFPDELPAVIPDNLKLLRVRHLLTMQTGHPTPWLMGFQRKTMKERDWVRFALNRPVPERPGTVFCYSNLGPYLMGVILERLTGMSLTDYLMPRLFEPLGIPHPAWDKDPLGQTFGAGGLYLTTTELARFGQLYLQRGLWEGRQVIPASWIRLVERTEVTSEDGESYSLLFWRGRHDSLCAVGRYGQYCVIVPEKNLVVAMNSMDEEDSHLLEYVWSYLYGEL
ncbi:MAG: beta-lactamase family protein [Lachnospiraceae bacterium]|nr:beta-lactamase family protein [Lachnospiraceae bacterium]